jgi:hypothetical protein
MDEENYNSDEYNYVIDEMVNIFINSITNTLIDYNINENFNATYDSLFDIFDTDYNRILEETFENQQSFEKTDHIIDIPSQTYSLIQDKDKYEKECCICLTQFDEDCIVSLLPKCNHILHKECMVEWGKYKTSCPICRNNVEEKN